MVPGAIAAAVSALTEPCAVMISRNPKQFRIRLVRIGSQTPFNDLRGPGDRGQRPRHQPFGSDPAVASRQLRARRVSNCGARARFGFKHRNAPPIAIMIITLDSENRRQEIAVQDAKPPWTWRCARG
jgi:hypothetical protein